MAEDDDHDLILLLRAFSITNGRPLFRATDGQHALDLLSRDDVRSKLDLIIADLKMPRLTGLELLSQVKQSERLRRVPFVLLTSSDEPSHRKAATARGADLYLVKPARLEDLLTVARRLHQIAIT